MNHTHNPGFCITYICEIQTHQFLQWITCLLPFLVCVPLVAQTPPPATVFQKGLWANKHHYTGNTITQNNSGEDWPYQMIPSYDLQNRREGYVLAGFATFTDIPYRKGVCDVFPPPSAGELECPDRLKGDYRATIFKIDEAGNMVWHKSFGGDEHSQFYSVTQSADKQYYYACGFTQGYAQTYNTNGNKMTRPTGDLCSGPYYPNREWHFYVVKITHNGSLVWERIYGEETVSSHTYLGKGLDIIETSSGDVIAVGHIDIRKNPSLPVAKSNRERQHYRVLIDGSTGDRISSVSGGSFDEQYIPGIVRTMNSTEEYALIIHCNDKPVGSNSMIMTIAPNLTIMQSPKFINPPAGAVNSKNISSVSEAYDIDVRKHNGELVVGSRRGSQGFILRIDPANLNLIAALEFEDSLQAYDLKVGITATSWNEIAVVSSSVRGRSAHINETITTQLKETSIRWPCMGATAFVDKAPWNYGADAILAVTTNNGTAIDFVQTYEHPGPFGTGPTDNVTQQECMYRIVEGPDGSLLACGNDSRNFDDYYIIKWARPCPESFNPSFDFVGSSPGNEFIVPFTAIWTGNSNPGHKVKGTIRVKAGAILTINGGTWRFSSSVPSGFIVEPGATLIINNATLTNLCYNYWNGIQVWGNNTLPESSPGQGRLRLNGCTVENAYRGIYMGHTTNGMLNGGRLYCDNSTFINCRVSVYFNSFSTQRGSYVKNSHFLTTAPGINDRNNGPLYYISIYESDGVQITGCRFENAAPGHPFKNDYRGTGIIGVASSFRAGRSDIPSQFLPPLQPVRTECSVPQGAPNVFIGLSKGIKAFGLGLHKCYILENEFLNTSIGIELSGYDHVVYKNHMVWNDNFINDANIPTSCGIFLDMSSRFLCEQNTIDFNNHVINQGHQGMFVQNSDDGINSSSHIFANTFINQTTNPNVVGNYFTGSNYRLQITCNNYINNVYDWKLDLGTTPFIMGNQLPGGQDPGNNFSSMGSNVSNIINRGSPFSYFTSTPIITSGVNVSAPVSSSQCSLLTDPCAAHFAPGQVLPRQKFKQPFEIFRSGKRQTSGGIPSDQHGKPANAAYGNGKSTPSAPSAKIPANNMSVKIYPNPASGSLQLEYDKDFTGSVCLSDIKGVRVIPFVALAAHHTKLDISQLTPGIYLLQIHASDGSLIKQEKIVIMH